MPKHAQGGKVNRSHTTVIDAAEIVIKTAEKLPEVSKISLGVITPKLPVGIHRIKFTPIQGGLRAEIRGTNSKQEILIYTTRPGKVEKTLTAAFR